MNNLLKPKERIDDLEYKGLKIIQNPEWFCFGMDSVLLSEFATDIKTNAAIVDLGTGTGIISILLSKKVNPNKIYGLEIQQDVADMAKRSVQLNNLEGIIEIISENVKKVNEILKPNSVDAVVTNPPYKKEKTGIQNDSYQRMISRHEVEANLEDFISAASYVLKSTGAFYMVHRPERLCDIIDLLRKYKIEPKRLQMVCSKQGKAPNLILIKGVKGAKPFLKVEKPLIIYKENGEYTKDVLEIYHKEK